MKRRGFLACLAVTGTAGCMTRDSPIDTAQNQSVDELRELADALVIITDEPAFDPDEVEIDVGETVAWKNTDTTGHSITADEETIPDQNEFFSTGGFPRETIASILYPIFGELPPSGSFVHTFRTPGRYEYYSLNPRYSLRGAVTVTPEN